MRNTIVKEFFHLLLCPRCKSEELRLDETAITCKRCKSIYKILDGIPVMLIEDRVEDVSFTTDKWDELYRNSLRAYENIDKYLHSQEVKDVLKYIEPLWGGKEKCTYMEIGCGPSLIGLHMFKKGHSVIGIDSSHEALKLAQDIYQRQDANGFFVCADINNIPIKNNSIDLLYGGGVIEHVNDLDNVVSELYRIMKPSGMAFNTVPYLSLGSLSYRQIWGNIPDFPILKQIAEFIHITLLGGKHMRFGYEKSFPIYKLKKTFYKAGFKRVNVGFFDCALKFEFVGNKRLKNIFVKLAKYKLFWPMVYVSSSK